MLVKNKTLLFILLCLGGSTVFAQKNVQTADICVYGGTAAGVVAAYTARQMGQSVILIEAGKHIGG
ncbi:MAG TPA: FAD-dependent oxidoreductase, partial [Agriterribacter sp.]|nr:FAD-dependent oxidoreductase [Agriterribacter sp.]